MRLYAEDKYIRDHMGEGLVGLELEGHRVDEQGHLAQTDHPFPDKAWALRDFSEDQLEINTPPMESSAAVLKHMEDLLLIVHEELERRGEWLWPFSNPPILRGEEDIRIAQFTGDQADSTAYRVYLAERYGKYKMTYSGIHYNYSFDDELLQKNFELERAQGSCDSEDFRAYKNSFYLRLAEKVLEYSWIVVALLAASPLVDSSFYERGEGGETLFTGFASLRCSDSGYWNQFMPILSYESLEAYAASIQDYIDRGLLLRERELYYPVRIKPAGQYTLETLLEKGVNHIELRQIDLNPLRRSGIDEYDLEFLKLLMIWLASFEMKPLSQHEQMQALANHKTAAYYDWNLARITSREGKTRTLRDHLLSVLQKMETFFAPDAAAVEIIQYQIGKTEGCYNRYPCHVRMAFGSNYCELGMQRAREIRQELRERE